MTSPKQNEAGSTKIDQLRRTMLLNTNNSASKVFMVHDDPSDTGWVALTTESDLYALIRQTPCAYATAGHNIEGAQADQLDTILRVAYCDKAFRQKYNYSSLFLIGSGAYGHVFRVVSNASGPLQNPLYNEDYVRFLQQIRQTKSRKRAALLDSYRDPLCLDLVAIKIEALTPDDIFFASANKIQLAKEFCMLTELFRHNTSANAMVGFPLPIEFGFLGSQATAKDLRKVLVFDNYGRPSNYHETFLGGSSILNFAATDVTYVSYMTMELVGPNLDEWKEFFAQTHSENGHVVFSVQTTLKLMDQVLCRLLVMHRKNMVHLDLKPDNLCMGIGKMTNTVYLLDYGLSRICSDEKPNITMGSRRYMSVGVLNMEPANYMMDIESWFYVLLVLLTDYVPWSDEALNMKLTSSTFEGQDEKLLVVARLKKQFWGDGCAQDKKLLQVIVDRAEALHKTDVPDIAEILMDIFLHIKRMRIDFHKVSASRMHSDIINDESDLFKRYHALRKLLLYPYDFNISDKGSCFANDKDMARKQEKRKAHYPMLVYAEKGRNWQWDWDVWFEEDYIELSSHNPRRMRRRQIHRKSHTAEEPMWKTHFMARVQNS